LNKTLIEHNCCPDLVQRMLILTFYVLKKSLKMKQEPKNNLFFNCRTKSKQLLKKELSNFTPALKNIDASKWSLYSGGRLL